MKGVGKIKEEDFSSSDRENEPKPKVRVAKRGKRFSQMETDLLLSMVMSSNVNRMETNRTTNRGRSMGWELITLTFNSSPGVVQRTEKELRDRTSNIRKDLYKLSRFQKASTQTTGHLPPPKPPSISFDLSEVVTKYAISLKVKLEGLALVDSDRVSHSMDEATSTPTTCRTINLFNSEVVSPTTALSHDATSTTSAMPSSSQIFATQSLRSPKLYTEGSSNSNSSTSLANFVTTNYSSPAQTYLENKSQLLADEIKRRKEWHNVCMEIKNEELAIKRKQSQFWSLIVNDVNRNQTNITDIVARAIGNSNPINYNVNYPTGQSFSAFEQSSPLNADKAHAEQSADDGAHADTDDMYESLRTHKPKKKKTFE